MRYTDIVKARALRRAGRACEMCGSAIGFETAQFVSAHPIFGVLFDQDDCCALCEACLAELDPATRAAAELGPQNGVLAQRTEVEADVNATRPTDADRVKDDAQGASADRPAELRSGSTTRLSQGPHEEWLPRRDPDGGMCA